MSQLPSFFETRTGSALFDNLTISYVLDGAP